MSGSWLSQLTNGIGSVFGDSSLGDDIGGWLDKGSSVVGSSSNKQEGGGHWTDNFLGSVLKAGTGLAGTYFQQSQNKSMAEAYAQQAAAQIAAEKEASAAKNAAAIKIARMNNLQALYNNWASLTERGGEAGAQAALGTGKSAIDPIMTRAAVLK